MAVEFAQPMGAYRFDYQIKFGAPRLLPMCEVHLLGPQAGVPVDVLIDTGAEFCIFPKHKASDAGIELPEKANCTVQYGGSGTFGRMMDCYLFLGEHKIKTKVVFADLAFPYALLGRFGLYSQFKEVVFLEKIRVPRVEFRF